MNRPTIFLLTALLLSACAEVRTGAATAPDPKTQMGALESRIAILVEEERLKLDPKAGRWLLTRNFPIVARARASDMAAKNYLAHPGPDGATSASFLMQQDRQMAGSVGRESCGPALHQAERRGGGGFRPRFLDEWLKSPPHRDNMAFADYDHAGVGAAVNGDTVYVAVLFSTDMGLPPRKPEGPASAVTTWASPPSQSAPGQSQRSESCCGCEAREVIKKPDSP